MSFFVAAFQSALLVRLRSWRTWLLLLIPLTVFGVSRLLPAEEAAAPVQVGVVLPRQGGEAFWRLLEERSGLVVSFLPAEAGQAERQVAAGQWDCALLLPDDFQERLERMDTYRIITVLTGPGSAAYPMVQETAAACLAELISPKLAEDYLLESGIANEAAIVALRPRLSEALLEQDRVLVTMETADGRELAPIVLADRGMDSLLSGLLAIVLMISALFAAMDLGRWLDSPFARRLLPLRGPLAVLLPRLAAELFPVLCAGALTLLSMEHPVRRLPSLLLYQMFLGAAALALARYRMLWNALPVLLPFVPAAGLLLAPVLLDLSQLVPALAPLVRWNPITLYLKACGGSWTDGLTLLLYAAVLLAVSWRLDRVFRGGAEAGSRC